MFILDINLKKYLFGGGISQGLIFIKKITKTFFILLYEDHIKTTFVNNVKTTH